MPAEKRTETPGENQKTRLIRQKGRRCPIRPAAILLACMLLIAAGLCSAESGIQIAVQEEEWSWIPGEVATFTGSVISEMGLPSGTVLQADINPEPKGEDPGRIVFTSVNGKKIKIRKQSESFTLEDSGEGEISFSGSWFIPEDSAYFRASITITVLNSEGESIGSAVLNCGANSGESGSSLLRIPVDIGKINLILAVSTGIIWGLAFLRIAACRKRKRNAQSRKRSETAG